METIFLIKTETKKDNLTEMPSIFNPAPKWIPLEKGKSYDLSKFDNQNSGDERFSIGTLAISLLISEVGAKKVFDFMPCNYILPGKEKKGEN